MASTQYCYALVVASLLMMMIMIDPSLAADRETQERIDQVCRQMEEYGFCDQTFKGHLKSPNADWSALTKITIEQGQSNATNTHQFITQLLRNTTDGDYRNNLLVCDSSYNRVIDAFHQAALAFVRKDYMSAYQYEMAIVKPQRLCDMAFARNPNPLTDRNREMRILITMGVVTCHKLF